MGRETSTKAPNRGARESVLEFPSPTPDGGVGTASGSVAASVVDVDSAVVVATE